MAGKEGLTAWSKGNAARTPAAVAHSRLPHMEAPHSTTTTVTTATHIYICALHAIRRIKDRPESHQTPEISPWYVLTVSEVIQENRNQWCM